MSTIGDLTRQFRVLCLLQESFGELGRAVSITGTQDGRQSHRSDVGVPDTCTLMLNNCRPNENQHVMNSTANYYKDKTKMKQKAQLSLTGRAMLHVT